MMWVILVHLFYWLLFFKEGIGAIIKSWLLFEMPLFFFIAGASNGMSRKKSLSEFYLSRLQRILIPYWIYALMCIIIMIIACPSESSREFVGLITSWILPINKQIITILYFDLLTWALWFIPVYILIMLVFPVLRKVQETNIQPVIVLTLIGLLITVLHFFDTEETVKEAVFYTFWTYLGLFYFDLFKKKRVLPAMLIILCCLFVMGVSVAFFGQSFNMQYNKLPPNYMFLLYSLAAMSVIYIFSDCIVRFVVFLKRNNIFCWIFKQYQENGLVIFLFHPFLFILLQKIRPVFSDIPSATVVFVLYLMLAIPIGAIIGKLFAWCGKIKIIKFG